MTVIPGVPDDHLERIHWYLGPAEGSQCAYRHLSSGIMVGGKRPRRMRVLQFNQLLIAKLAEKLRAAGIIAAE